jgi:hypothetical protein
MTGRDVAHYEGIVDPVERLDALRNDPRFSNPDFQHGEHGKLYNRTADEAYGKRGKISEPVDVGPLPTTPAEARKELSALVSKPDYGQADDARAKALAAVIEGGAPPSSAASRAPAPAKNAPAASSAQAPTEYATKELNGDRPRIDAVVWEAALPHFKALGLSDEQVTGLAKVLPELERLAEAQRVQAGDQLQADSEKHFREALGADYEPIMKFANQILIDLLPNDHSKALALTPLEGGGVIGSHPQFIELMLAVIREGQAFTGQIKRLSDRLIEAGLTEAEVKELVEGTDE